LGLFWIILWWIFIYISVNFFKYCAKIPDMNSSGEDGFILVHDFRVCGGLASCTWAGHNGDMSMWGRTFFTSLQTGSREKETGRDQCQDTPKTHAQWPTSSS
jgi:hypothetical protein